MVICPTTGDRRETGVRLARLLLAQGAPEINNVFDTSKRSASNRRRGWESHTSWARAPSIFLNSKLYLEPLKNPKISKIFIISKVDRGTLLNQFAVKNYVDSDQFQPLRPRRCRV